MPSIGATGLTTLALLSELYEPLESLLPESPANVPRCLHPSLVQLDGERKTAVSQWRLFFEIIGYKLARINELKWLT